MARQLASTDVDAAELWVAIGTLEQDIAYTQQRFGLHMADSRPQARQDVGDVSNVVLLPPR